MALTDKLTAIGDAIREKTGGTELMTLDAMPTEIASIQTGGGGDLPEEAFTITGDCASRFANGGWDWFIENYGNKITTKDITNANYMFSYSTIDRIPFEINLKLNPNGGLRYMFNQANNLIEIPDMDCTSSSYISSDYMFNTCSKLENLPYLYNLYPGVLNYFFYQCYSLREIPDDYMDTWNFSRVNSYGYAGLGCMFQECRSLRQIPQNILNKFGEETFSHTSTSNFFYNGFRDCYTLDELINLPFSTNTAYTSNIFSGTFTNCHRLKDITFETYATGAAKPAKWKGQTIDLSKYVGYAQYERSIVDYNSGITADKNAANCGDVYDFVENYANDADWFSTMVAYSRYNRRSAINTINSLPDTSAYLAANGGTNTIKFLGDSGSAHPMDYSNPTAGSSAISYLTAEEIAVATAKGWTVTFV